MFLGADYTSTATFFTSAWPPMIDRRICSTAFLFIFVIVVVVVGSKLVELVL